MTTNAGQLLGFGFANRLQAGVLLLVRQAVHLLSASPVLHAASKLTLIQNQNCAQEGQVATSPSPDVTAQPNSLTGTVNSHSSSHANRDSRIFVNLHEFSYKCGFVPS